MGWWNWWSRSSGADDEAASDATAGSGKSMDTAEMRTFTAAELAKFTGDKGTPIYVSVKGKVYDCTSGAAFYGPGKSYAVFAGKEASRCLGKMLISDEEANANWDDLAPEHMQTLDEWAAKFESKYPVIGTFEPDDQYYARQKLFTP
ncbi:Cytochrome b5-like Heme/Steroid binding domain containing protein [Novymonas esmeraldas]|uniref:Cytochrome b5-like Heme/Steroid binding domain containing protein n=1 Tax=Novymonas esmeraldas TaxID=1808958 RepID=A0AAW0FEU8_9TRYP